MKPQKIAIVCIILFFINLQAFPKSNEIDSLTTILDSGIHDSTYIKAGISLAINYLYTNPDTSEYLANNALKAAQKTNSLVHILKAFKIIGSCNFLKGNLDKALSNMLNSLEIGNKLLLENPTNNDYKILVSGIYGTIGLIHYNQASYDLAIGNHLKSLKLSEEADFYKGISICLNNIGIVYLDMVEYDKALEYNYKALKIAKKMGKAQDITQSLNNLGAVYLAMPNFDSAYYYISKCVGINVRDNNETELTVSYENLAHIFDNLAMPDSAIYYNEKALAISKRLKNMEGMVDCNFRMAEIYFTLGDYHKAEIYSKECLRLANESGMQNMQINANKHLSKIAKSEGDYRNAYRYFVAGSAIKDSVFSAEKDKRIAEMEVKYETEKKEKQIELLNKENQINKLEIEKKRTVLWVSLTLASLVVLSLVFVILYLRKKQKVKQMMVLQESQNKLLKMERKVLTTIIETEDKERKRFAEDIHDGIGPLLSSIKLYLGEIASAEKDEQKQMVDFAKELTSEAIVNIRDISHNIMPGPLSENGMIESVKEFCDKIQFTKQLRIKIKNGIGNKRFGNSVELILYRTIIELVNNTIKHAKASGANISFVEENGLLEINYSDNGIGFDTEKIEGSDKKGIGLLNIKSRIASINGICDIKSTKEKGIEVNIKISV